jgi:predicted DNA-binding protein
MPNQRKKGTKLQTLWLSAEEKATLKKLAKQQGLTVTAFLKKELNQHLDKNRDQQ